MNRILKRHDLHNLLKFPEIWDTIRSDLKHDKFQNNVKGWNVQTVVLNALVSTLDIVSQCSRDEGFTEKDMDLFKRLISINRIHMQRLYKLRNMLKHIVKNIYPIKNIMHKGHKQHLIEHIPSYIRRYGPMRMFDTERSEKWHMVMKGVSFIIDSLISFRLIIIGLLISSRLIIIDLLISFRLLL